MQSRSRGPRQPLALSERASGEHSCPLPTQVSLTGAGLRTRKTGRARTCCPLMVWHCCIRHQPGLPTAPHPSCDSSGLPRRWMRATQRPGWGRGSCVQVLSSLASSSVSPGTFGLHGQKTQGSWPCHSGHQVPQISVCMAECRTHSGQVGRLGIARSERQTLLWGSCAPVLQSSHTPCP